MLRIAAALLVRPFGPLTDAAPEVVEIYTSIAARDAGLLKGRTKIRDSAMLDPALERLDSQPIGGAGSNCKAMVHHSRSKEATMGVRS